MDNKIILFQAILYVHPWFKKIKKTNDQTGIKLALSKNEIEKILFFLNSAKAVSKFRKELDIEKIDMNKLIINIKQNFNYQIKNLDLMDS